MATITSVTAQKRQHRYNFFLDGHYAFSVSEKTLAEFVLLKGKTLTDQQVAAIQQFDVDAKVSDLAAQYLSYEPRTVHEVSVYLTKKGASPEALAHAVAELTDLGLLDDEAYVQLFIKHNLRVGSHGPMSLARQLAQKGIADELAENALAAVPDDDWLPIGQKIVRSLTSQVGKLSSREVNRKMQAKLRSHGFSGDLLTTILANAEPVSEGDDELEALKRQGIKAYKRFRRLPAAQQQQKMRQYLYQHGFSGNQISAFLAGEIISFSELAEY